MSVPSALAPRSADRSGAAENPVVEVRTLRKAFGASVAVDDLSLRVAQGEVLCLLGPSGCGKTTTLRMIAGFMEPDAGTIMITGADVTRAPPYRRDTGMVFQGYALFPHMSVEQNIAFGLANIGVPSAERRARVAEMLTLVELPHLAKRYPKELSGGQQQRVALARALAIRPAVLLLDEPFSNLDTQLRVRLREELRRLIDRIGVTTILVTHDQEEAVVFSDKIAVMNAGRLIQLGTPAEIYERPIDRFVATFVGECSLVEGTVTAGSFISRHGLAFPFPGADGPARLMIRPEHLGIAPGPDALQARVISAVFTGSKTRVELALAGERLIMQSFFRHARMPREGDDILVTIDSASVHRIN